MKTKIIDLSHDGKGVGKVDNKVVFIENAYPEEVVKFKITKEKKNYSEGKILEILEKSKDRVPSICDNFYRCNGCQFCDYKYESQLEFKKNLVVDNFLKFGKIKIKEPEILGMDNPIRYRNHIQLTVKNGKIGYIDKKNDSVFTPKDCKVAFEELNDIINLLYKIDLKDINLFGIRKNYKGEILIIVVLRKNRDLNIEPILEDLKSLGVKYIYKNINKNPRFHYGKDSEKIYGIGNFTEEILGNKFILSPTSFFQINKTQAESLYKIGINNLDLKKDDKVLELFSGIGTMSLEIGKKVKEVTAIEYSKESTEAGKLNARFNNIKNIKFLAGKAENLIGKVNEDFNKIILDPPRKGGDKKVLKEILRKKPEIISYISCNPATLARDIKILTEDGNYKLEKVEVVDMFPQTSHVESVVLMSRVKD